MYFRAKNLVSLTVTQLKEPWKVEVDPYTRTMTKKAFRTMSAVPTFDHYFLSMAEGRDPALVVSDDNPPVKLHGFIADYDGIYDADLFKQVVDTMKTRRTLAPTWVCMSRSGGSHLVWEFEHPVSVVNMAHAKEFLTVFAQRVQVTKWGAGYDVCSEKPTQKMEIGYNWTNIGERVPVVFTHPVCEASYERAEKKNTRTEMRIPIAVVREELFRRHLAKPLPHEPPRNFDVGVRCRRFWDEEADNDNACIIREDGIQVFTPHDNGFVGWERLLGTEFCSKYLADASFEVTGNIFYNFTRHVYLRKRTDVVPPRFEEVTERDLDTFLTARTGVSRKSKDGAISPLEKLKMEIRERNGVIASAPILYRNSGLLTDISSITGGNVLNTSTVRAMTPATGFRNPQLLDDDLVWSNPDVSKEFPFIYQLLTTMFLTREEADRWYQSGYAMPFDFRMSDPRVEEGFRQLDYLIAWMAVFYRNAESLCAKPSVGQILFLAGGAGVGKSFFATQILDKLMGGSTNAHGYYLKGEKYTASLVDVPIHLIDDQIGSSDIRQRDAMTVAFKVVAANGRMRYEKKYGDALEAVPWAGRVVVLCNDHPQALSVLPELDESTEDKFTMLKCGGGRYDFGSAAENQERLAEELPFFARYLKRCAIADEYRSLRYGSAAYQHTDMKFASVENTGTQDLIEALSMLFSAPEYVVHDSPNECWVGTSNELFRAFNEFDMSVGRAQISAQSIRRKLTRISKVKEYGITQRTLGSSGKVWYIPYASFRRKTVRIETV